MTKTWEEVEEEMAVYRQSKRYKIDQFIYRMRRFFTSPLRWRHNIKHWYQRANRGYADSDMWSFDHYVAGLIASYLRWQVAHGHGVSMHYAYDLDEYNPDIDIMVERRNKEYDEIAWIFEEYAKNGHALNEEWRIEFGGVLDSDLDIALQWFSKHFTSLWD